MVYYFLLITLKKVVSFFDFTNSYQVVLTTYLLVHLTQNQEKISEYDFDLYNNLSISVRVCVRTLSPPPVLVRFEL